MAHFEKYKAPALGNMCAHYARVPELERGYTRDNIDPSRMALNYNLGPTRPGVTQVDFISSRIASLGLKRLRKDAVRMADCVVTMPRNAALEGREREFFEAVYRTLEAMFGRANVISAYVHMDESQPHMHFAFVPVTRDGRLSCKDVLTRPFLKGFHGVLETNVSHALGLDRSGLCLTDEEREERGGEYVGLEEYKAAKDAAKEQVQRLESVQRKCETAEAERDGLARVIEPVAEAGALELGALALGRGLGERERSAAEENEQLRAGVQHLEAEKAELERECEALDRRAGGLARELGRARRALQEAVRGWLEAGLGYLAGVGRKVAQTLSRAGLEAYDGPAPLDRQLSDAVEASRAMNASRGVRHHGRGWDAR